MPRRAPQPNQAIPTDEEFIRQWHRVGNSAADLICNIIDYASSDYELRNQGRVRGAVSSLIDEAFKLAAIE